METQQSHKALRRLRRIEGQVRGTQKMIEEDRYCIEVFTQVRAVIAALHGVEDFVMGNHLSTCVAAA